MIISVASGKGGTGKTTIAVNLALSLKNIKFLDCDVEEPNAHLFLNPDITTKTEVKVTIPQINKEKCNYCGDCSKICTYRALGVFKKTILFFNELCHNCLGCYFVCKQKAIEKGEKSIGLIEKGYYGYSLMNYEAGYLFEKTLNKYLPKDEKLIQFFFYDKKSVQRINAIRRHLYE